MAAEFDRTCGLPTAAEQSQRRTRIRDIRPHPGSGLGSERVMDARTAEQIPQHRSSHEKGSDGLGALRRRPLLVGAIALLILAIVIAGVVWWLNARHYESTDDAFIDARTVTISAQVSANLPQRIRDFRRVRQKVAQRQILEFRAQLEDDRQKQRTRRTRAL